MNAEQLNISSLFPSNATSENLCMQCVLLLLLMTRALLTTANDTYVADYQS
jgi:hypothetical protein